jgi:single stranded DNA-binding protein
VERSLLPSQSPLRRVRRTGRGNWQDRTEWPNLVAFKRTAEVVRDYVRKGSQVLIKGKIQTRTWDDRESGQKKYRIEILVHDLTLLGGRSEDRGRDSGYGRGLHGLEWRALDRPNRPTERTTPTKASGWTIFPF